MAKCLRARLHRNLVSSSGSSASPFGFAGSWGYQTDSVSGLMLLGNRYYDASTGRFLTPDPGMGARNWCTYAKNNPQKWIDPGGFDSAADFFAGWGDALTFGGTKYVRHWIGDAVGIGDAIESFDYRSAWYTGGQVVGAVHSIALDTAVAARAAGWTTKIGLHPPHHKFGRLGKLRHMQINARKLGAKGSGKGKVVRIPFPFRT